MPVLRFKKFEDLDEFERKGKGINWRFKPDASYISKALKFQVRVPIPPGVYRFKTFEEAEEWERKWWVKSGAAKRTR